MKHPLHCKRTLTAVFVAMISGWPTAIYAASIYELHGSVATATLPAGNDYYHIDAQVVNGGTHGAPMVVGGPKGSSHERSLFVAQENSGVVSFGTGMAAVSLRTYETGTDPSPFTVVNDLRHMPNGSPLLIGASSSMAAPTNGEEATIWALNPSGNQLAPRSLGFVGGIEKRNSILVGGNSVDGYAGSDSTSPTFVPPTGGGQLLDAGGVFLPGSAVDLEDQFAVGNVDSHVAFWKKGESGNWTFSSVQLPAWSDGTGEITDIAGHLMGGYLYSPEIDDVVPVLWNTDGTLNKVFDLVGYNVTEMVEDHGSVVVLLNQGTVGQFYGPSRVYAEGWVDTRLYFGDIVPALEEGTTGFVVDFSSGGSLWTLTQFTDASGTHYSVTDILSSAVPEPSTLALLYCAAMLGSSRRRLTA